MFTTKILYVFISSLFFETFRMMLGFYGEDLLASRPAPKLQDHHMSAVRIINSLYI